METELPFNLEEMILVSRKQLQVIRNTFNLVEPETLNGEDECFELFYDEGRETLLAVIQYSSDADVKYYIRDGILEDL